MLFPFSPSFYPPYTLQLYHIYLLLISFTKPKISSIFLFTAFPLYLDTPFTIIYLLILIYHFKDYSYIAILFVVLLFRFFAYEPILEFYHLQEVALFKLINILYIIYYMIPNLLTSFIVKS